MKRLFATVVPFILFVATMMARVVPHAANGAVPLTQRLKEALPGDTILVSGEVREGTLTIDRPMALIGAAGAVIDGDDAGDVVVITADDVTVQGFTVRGSRISDMHDNAGIKVLDRARAHIVDNFLDGCFFGIYLSGSRDAVVQGNRVVGHPQRENRMGNGIHLWHCHNVRILDNLVRDHRDGIYFEFVTDTRIERNKSLHNLRYGLHFMFSNRNAYSYNRFQDNGAGVAVMYSHHMEMRHNRFLSNRGASSYGLLLKEINDGVLEDNEFADNTTGLLVDGCNRFRIVDNSFRANGWALRLFANATACVITRNLFVGNTFDLSTNGDLMLNDINGNYWDRYVGYDLDRDGYGDVPYRPLGFFGLLVERMPYAMVFSRSLLVALLDQAERLIPTLTPLAMKDDHPLMRMPNG
ncbi:MAG: nitrous oxide reductase family maturation protein NosD [Flavobacteriales bacterium]|nr:nitrous oxide reductase family maturation protein NosD [Flavobacteriales bacterium]